MYSAQVISINPIFPALITRKQYCNTRRLILTVNYNYSEYDVIRKWYVYSNKKSLYSYKFWPRRILHIQAKPVQFWHLWSINTLQYSTLQSGCKWLFDYLSIKWEDWMQQECDQVQGMSQFSGRYVDKSWPRGAGVFLTAQSWFYSAFFSRLQRFIKFLIMLEIILVS